MFMTLTCDFEKAFNQNCFVKSWEGNAFCSTSQATCLRVSEWMMHMLTDCEGLENPCGFDVSKSIYSTRLQEIARLHCMHLPASLLQILL